MTMTKSSKVSIAAAAFLLSMAWIDPAVAEIKAEDILMEGNVIPLGSEEEGIAYDPNTGNYVVTYKTYDVNGDEMLYRLVFVPATKIEPTLKSKFEESKSGKIIYRYKIRNGPKSNQALISLRLIASSADETSQTTPKNWRGNATPNIGSFGVRVNWSYWRGSRVTSGIAPGQSLSGFSLESEDLPGVDVAKMEGATPIAGFAGEGPQGKVGDEFDKLRLNNFVPLPAAVPKIPVPDPFDARVVIAGLQKHLKDDIVSMQLIDPVFATQLDRYLQGAIDAANAGNTAGVKGNLKDFRRLLKSEHDDIDKDDDKDNDDKNKDKSKKLIDKLAARVLDFDARYVLKRFGGDD